MHIKYRLQEWLVRVANSIGSNPGDQYQYIDNQRYLSREYIQSYIDRDSEVKASYIISDEGWEPVTSDNFQEIIDDLDRSVEIRRQTDEQANKLR